MAPAKTLYIRDNDMTTWKQAETWAKDNHMSISQVATMALRRFLDAPTREEIDIMVAPHSVPIMDLALSGGRPILQYGQDPVRGYGWMLYFQPLGGTSKLEVRFFLGRAEQPPLDEARAWIREADEAGGMKEIVIEVGDRHGNTWEEQFVGRWLVEPDRDETRTGEQGFDAGQYWGIALTKRGRIAVYTAHCNDRWAPRLDDYDNLDRAEVANLPADILAQAAAELGEQRVIRRDI